MSFESNHGQADPDVDFVARGGGYSISLKDGQVLMSLRRAQRAPDARGPASRMLTLHLVGANAAPVATGESGLAGTSNYFWGNDPNLWITAIPTYAQVRYAEVYSGVDLVLYGRDGQLEYDLVAQPGADLGSLGLEFAGSDSVQLDDGGGLLIDVGAAQLRQSAPRVYQESPGGQREVGASYVLGEDHVVRFAVRDYDPALPLVIDPVLEYSTFLGTGLFDIGRAIAVDQEGNAYVTGTVEELSTTPGAFQPTGRGTFVAKLNPTGTALVYATFLSAGTGGGFNDGFGIAVDSAGNAFVTGSTNVPDFPTTPGAFQRTLDGVFGAFVTKLNPTGTDLVYSTYVGGGFTTGATAVAVDRAGAAYVTGGNQGSFPTTSGAFQPSPAGQSAFAIKLNPTGSALIYGTLLGGSDSDVGNGIAVDDSGNAFIVGSTSSTDFPTTAGAFQRMLAGFGDAFVTKLNPNGSALVYSTLLGGSIFDTGNAIALDRAGSAYVTGNSFNDFPTTPGAFQTTPQGNGDAFVTKLSATGGSLVYSTLLGGADGDVGSGIAVDASGNAYVTGSTGAGFPTTPDAFQPLPGGEEDGFITKVNAAGTALAFSTFVGGNSFDRGLAVAADASGSAYLTGTTGSANFPTTPGSLQPTRNPTGSSSIFVSKIAVQAGAVLGSLQLNGSNGFAEAPHAADLNLTGDWTVELWLRDEHPMEFNHDYVTLLNKGDRQSNGESPYMVTLGFKQLVVGVRSAWTDQVLTYNLRSGAVDPRKWHHVAASFGVSDRRLMLYVDGVKVGERLLPTTSRGNTLPVQIGRNGPQAGKYFRGKIDDVRIWNVVRSGSEIAANYQSQLSGSQPGLVANWRFDETNGPVGHDSAGTHDTMLSSGAGFSTDVHQ